MEFCPECGKLLIPKKKGKSKLLFCAKCGYENKLDQREGYEVQDEVQRMDSIENEVEELKQKIGK